MSKLQHAKQVAKVMSRAGIPLFIMGAHGTGKTSIIYQLYLEACGESGSKPVSFSTFQNIVFRSQTAVKGNTEVDIDITSLSSIDGKSLANANFSREEFGFWSLSAANVTLEEFVGMPWVQDRGAMYNDVYLRTLEMATRLLDGEMSQEFLFKIHAPLFERVCGDLGLSENDRNRVALKYLRMHNLLPDPDHTGGGFWLIDELNLGLVEVEKALMQMLLEKRYLDYVLPDNVWVVTTMNPPTPEYPAARELALPTLDRGALLYVESDKTEWAEWASKRGMSEGSRLFVDRNDKILNAVEKNVDATVFDNPGTYRSVEMADRAFSLMTSEEITDVGITVATSLLGRSLGSLFHKTYVDHAQHPLSLEDVIHGYGWNKDMSSDQVRDYKSWKATRARTRLMAMVKKANVKSELINYTLAELTVWAEKLYDQLRERGNSTTSYKHTDEEKGEILNVLLFLNDLPPDISRSFFNDKIDAKCTDLFHWTGKLPLARDFYDRIEVDFQRAVDADGGGDA